MKRKDLARVLCAALVVGSFGLTIPAPQAEGRAQPTASEEARVIVLTGTVQHAAGAAKDWDPSDLATRMKPLGDGFYELTVDLPAGAYYYKIACGGSWAENYGLGGNFDGANVQLTLDKPTRVTFYYNDRTHRIADSTSYAMKSEAEEPRLTGAFLQEAKPMADLMLDEFYQVEAEVPAGEQAISIERPEGAPLKQSFSMKQAGKATFYYDAKAGRLIVDDGRIEENKVIHDTWSTAYRVPFEAVEAGTPATLTLETGAGQVDSVGLVLRKAAISAKGGDEYNPDFSEAEGATREVLPLARVASREGKDIWSLTFTPKESGIYGYTFLLNGVMEYGDDARPGHTGVVKLRGAKPFQLTVYESGYHTPDWAKEAICYQIFPDRFYNGDPANDNARATARGSQPIQHRQWSELPANHSKTPEADTDLWECNDFFGGDLAGIEKKLDYLKDMGFTAIYVNPLSAASSNHRYDARDYGSIDPILGTQEDFAALVTAMDKRGMRLIMDGVFNHVGDDSIYFDRYGKYESVGAYEYWSRIYDKVNAGMALEEAKAKARAELQAEGQKFSPYGWENWFEIKNERAKDSMGKKYAYHDWQGYDSLVPFRDSDYPAFGQGRGTSSLGDYLLYGNGTEKGVLPKWFDDGLSGWRLDVAKEVPPDFWKNVRKELKTIPTRQGGEPLLLGEIWQDGSQFLTGDTFDSVMNYKLSFAIGDLFLLRGDAKAADEELTILRQNYPKEAFFDLMNIVDSHDTVRAIYKFGGGAEATAQPTKKDFDYGLGKARLKLAVAFLMGYPGMPTIYYGDEAGLYGSSDPDDRRTYPWGQEDRELLSFYKKAIAARNEHKALFAHGDVKTLEAQGDVYAFERTAGKEGAIVALNRGKKTRLELPVSFAKTGKLKDVFTGDTFAIKEGKLAVELGENQARLLVLEP